MTLGARILEAREVRLFSVAQVARQMVVKEKTVRKWEAGKSKPRADKLPKLAGILGVPLLWLMDGDNQFDPVDSAPTGLERLEQKVERMNALQQDLAQLSGEIARDVEIIRRREEALDNLVA